MLRRFLDARIAKAEPPEGMATLGPTERYEARVTSFREALSPPLARWRAQPSVFAPTLPEEFDVAKLEHMLVGVQDGAGRCLGLGGIGRAHV